MEGYSRRLLFCVVAFLGAGGVLLCLVGPTLPAGAQDSRVLQVWPDRSIGVTSGLLEGSTAHAATQVLPFGVCRTSAGDVVHARTYLHFPLGVFPPGTDILRATLYVYVDGASDAGEATVGVYRVLEPWEEEDWSGDPVTWPTLLTSAIAVTTVRFDAVMPVSISVPTATPAFTPTPTLTATETSMLFSKPAGHALVQATSPLPTPPTSPLPTPTSTPGPTPTSTPTSTPGATPTSTPVSTPGPTPTSSLSPDVPVVSLGQAAETWLTWDVTALMRAWLANEVSDDGLALAPAPDPDADPETADDLLVARWLAAADPNTRPHLIVEFEVHPVTPTPVPVLPYAGSYTGWRGAGLLLVGVVLLILGLIRLRR